MDLATQIKELERKLLLKKAFDSVGFTFGKGYKAFPEDVRLEVEETLKQYATKHASEEEAKLMPDSTFTIEEIEALRVLAQTVIAKKSATKAEQPKPETKKKPTESKFVFVSNDSPEVAAPSKVSGMGQVLMLDNVHPSVRNKLEPECRVRVLETKGEKSMVVDRNGISFWIPTEDIELD